MNVTIPLKLLSEDTYRLSDHDLRLIARMTLWSPRLIDDLIEANSPLLKYIPADQFDEKLAIDLVLRDHDAIRKIPKELITEKLLTIMLLGGPISSKLLKFIPKEVRGWQLYTHCDSHTAIPHNYKCKEWVDWLLSTNHKLTVTDIPIELVTEDVINQYVKRGDIFNHINRVQSCSGKKVNAFNRKIAKVINQQVLDDMVAYFRSCSFCIPERWEPSAMSALDSFRKNKSEVIQMFVNIKHKREDLILPDQHDEMWSRPRIADQVDNFDKALSATSCVRYFIEMESKYNV